MRRSSPIESNSRLKQPHLSGTDASYLFFALTKLVAASSSSIIGVAFASRTSSHIAINSATAAASPSTTCQPEADPGACQRPMVRNPLGVGAPVLRNRSAAALYELGGIFHSTMNFIVVPLSDLLISLQMPELRHGTPSSQPLSLRLLGARSDQRRKHIRDATETARTGEVSADQIGAENRRSPAPGSGTDNIIAPQAR